MLLPQARHFAQLISRWKLQGHYCRPQVQPSYHLPGFSENHVHMTDFMASLVETILINAYGVDPKNSGFLRIAHVSQGS
jgi:hypothetical protein